MSDTVVRRARVQGTYARGERQSRPPGTIAWWEHEDAWAGYAKRYGTSQSAERIHERMGFDYTELTDFLGHEPTTWEPR